MPDAHLRKCLRTRHMSWHMPLIPSCHTHSDYIPCPSVSIEGEEIGQGCLSYTQRLQDILRHHSTNNGADRCKLMDRRRDRCPVPMVVGCDTQILEGNSAHSTSSRGIAGNASLLTSALAIRVLDIVSSSSTYRLSSGR